MRIYSDYQTINLPWLTAIPAHWCIDRLKNLLYERKENNKPIKTRGILSLTNTRGVIPYSQKGNIGNRSKENLEDYHLAYPNDLVLNSMNVIIGSVGVSSYYGAISPVYYALVSRGTISIKYCEYIFRLPTFEESLKGLGNGILEIRRRIPMTRLNNVALPIPPREEQDQIVRFLDWKVSEINRLINIKHKEIGLLKEQLAVYISKIIVSGVIANVSIKPCDIEWIGAIPDHWDVMRCKYLFSERDERSVEGKEPHLSMSQKYGLIPDEQLDERRMLSESYAGAKICYKNDLVLNRLKAHLGVFALAPQLGVISPDYTVLMPNTDRILPEFAEMVLKSQRCRRELRIRVRGVTEGFWRLYTDDFNTISIPVPPLEEQQQIMDAVSSYIDKMKQYESCLTNEIEVLHEFRTRLISDVVTGKIDVRGIEIPEYEDTAEEADTDSEAEAEDLDEGGEEI